MIVTSEAAVRGLSELVNRAAFGRERVVITRHKRPVAALVNMKDFEALGKLDTLAGASPAKRVSK